MRFTAQEEYGLRCLLEIARSPDDCVTIPQGAKRQALTTAYVAKLLRCLRRVGLVDSVRGQKGGFRLARSADQVDLHTILTSLGGRFYSAEHCRRYGGGEANPCPSRRDCSIRTLWAFVDGVLSDALRNATLADLLEPEKTVGDILRGAAKPPG